VKILLGVLAALAISTGAEASVVFDFGVGPNGVVTSSWQNNQGQTHTYTASGLSITASAFGPSLNGHADQLYGKHGGGDENGLGMTNDSAGQNEIYYNKGFIQLDLNALAGHVVAGSEYLSFGSTTQNEQWTVYGSNSAGVIGTAALPVTKTFISSGGAENTLVQLTGGYRYYDVISSSSSGGKNVLLKSLTVTATPEPSTWAMMMLGVFALGGTLRMKRRAGVVA
jgi:hypothetical protein